MQGKRDITSDTKCYDVSNVLVSKEIYFFGTKSYCILFERSFIADHLLLKDHDVKIT